MLDAEYVLRADEIPDDLWAVSEPVLLPHWRAEGCFRGTTTGCPWKTSHGV